MGSVFVRHGVPVVADDAAPAPRQAFREVATGEALPAADPNGVSITTSGNPGSEPAAGVTLSVGGGPRPMKGPPPTDGR